MAKVFKYVPKSAPSEWATDVLQLSTLPEGEGLIIEGDKSARVAFQRAAREAGFTARCVSTKEVGEDKFEFGFIAVELRTRKTAKPAEDSDASEDADATEVAEAE